MRNTVNTGNSLSPSLKNSAPTDLASLSRLTTTPVKFWGAIGLFFILIQVYSVGRWMLSDAFVATPVGSDIPPEGYVAMIRFWEITTLCFFVGILIYTVRSCILEKRITTSLLLFLAWLSCFWQDALSAYYRMFIVYSSYFVNRGSWYPFVPGWISPNAQGISEPLLFNLGNYGGTLPMLTFVGAWALGAYRRKNPTASLASMIVVTILLGMILDFVFEFLYVRMGLYAFPSTFAPLTLFAGQVNQYPMYETFFFGPVIGTAIFLNYLRDDKGAPLAERGAEKLKSPAGRVCMRFLALAGVMNTAMLVFYTLPVWYLCFYNDFTVPNVPSYLLNEVCGAGTQFECPGPNVPVPLPGSGPIPPFSGRN